MGLSGEIGIFPRLLRKEYDEPDKITRAEGEEEQAGDA